MTCILGIHDAHDSSVCLMINGEIIAAVQNERFTRRKNDYGVCKEAIDYCLSFLNNVSEIDFVVLASESWNPVLTKIKRSHNFSVQDWVDEQNKFWKYELGLEKKVERGTLIYPDKVKVNYYNLFKDRKDFVYDDFYPINHLLNGYMDKKEMEELKDIRINTIAEYLGTDKSKIMIVRHENCHTYYAYFGSNFRKEVLSLTAEGIGDYSNSTVSIQNKNGRLEMANTLQNHIGHIYQYITLILGMKPAQHEYKVMGMAPYANEHEIEKSYRVFKDILKIEGLSIIFKKKPKDLYFHFKKELEGHRFDGIAGGLQRWVEDILEEWVETCIKSTGLNNVIFSGGVAQNIKACKRIAENKEVSSIEILPAAGDTSISIGACYYANFISGREGKKIDNIYLGPEYYDEYIDKFLDNYVGEYNIKYFYPSEKYASNYKIAKALTEGKIIGRCFGRMEFGQRALGNRSILADPRNIEVVKKINDAIKFRDFWMPFTPTILKEDEEKFIINPKNIRSPFMTMAFESTEFARKNIPAALHPADFTVRPQILEEKDNPEYYALIKAFKERTGVGAVLNTSFNLHGDPIVLTPEDALYTFENSGLDILILNNFYIEKRK